MHRRACSASCKARVMQAKANPLKEKTRGGPDRRIGGLHDWASSCVGAPPRRREGGLPLLVGQSGAGSACTFGPKRYSPATSIGDTACPHRSCRSAALVASREQRLAA